MRTGLVSVSFRHLSPEEIIDLAAKCGLKCIEWGGDVHVPPGDIAHAARIGRLTQERGLQTACYGSYYRLTDPETPDMEAIVQTAIALGAPLIRVWAGNCGSAAATAAQRDAVCRNARALADAAAEHGIGVAFEWHGGTLTDTLESAMHLLKDIGHENIGTLWQPPVGMVAEDCAEQIRSAAKGIRNIHAFSWNGTDRLALAAGERKWRRCLQEIAKLPGERDILLEFVAGDDPAQLSADAETLKRWMRGEWSE